PLDVLFRQPAVARDGDGLLLAGAQILRGHLDDAVDVDVKGDFDLRHAAGRRRDAGQLEAAQGDVVRRHRPLALEDVDLHRGLVVRRRGEDLLLAGGNGGVPLDQLGEDAAQGLNAQGKGRYVQVDDVLHLAG